MKVNVKSRKSVERCNNIWKWLNLFGGVGMQVMSCKDWYFSYTKTDRRI